MLTVSVVSPERTLFEGEAESLVAPAYDGEVGIMSMHAPMLTLLGSGELRLNAAGGERLFAVFGGFLEVADDRVRIVTERAESK
jgi:F-type H+-transporting ATPase subunit epsilon